jgi:hypothetical protein
MTISMFSQFQDFLASAVQDTDFVRKNTLMQDATYKQTMLDRINALTADVVIRETPDDVISQLGVMEVNDAARTIDFVPRGFQTTLSAYREGTVLAPRFIHVNTQTSPDNVRYILSDWSATSAGAGAWLLNEQMEVKRRFPNYGANTAGGQYETAADAISVMIGDALYFIVANYTHHVVQIYSWTSPYAYISSIGTINVSGADNTHLFNPWALAFNPVTNYLYIACPTGQPAGATASNGFIAVWDLTAPAAPVFVSIPWFYAGTGSLVDTQVHTPTSLSHDGTYLWVSNGNNSTIGAFTGAAVPLCTRYIEAQGAGYYLRNPVQICAYALTGGFVKLFAANALTGTVEEFDGVTYEHLNTYGIRANEDNVVGYQRLSSRVFGALGTPVGVAVDAVTIDDQTTTVMVVTDTGNNRLHRFNLDAYAQDNYVNFAEQSFGVPVSITGWSLDGTLPIRMAKVYYRFAATEQFRELPQEAQLPASRTVQFRLVIDLATDQFLTAWNIKALTIRGIQA